jgi:hypothetical protein
MIVTNIIGTTPPSGTRLFRVAAEGWDLKPNFACHGAKCVLLPDRIREEELNDLRTSSASFRCASSYGNERAVS